MPLRTRLRSVLTEAKERASGADTEMATAEGHATQREESADPETSLFECPSCETVYVAVEKSTCSTCDSAVDEVSATLSDPSRDTTEVRGSDDSD